MVDREILVLEDETFIAMDIELTLAEAGFQKVSVHSKSASALQWLDDAKPAAALLDFNLGRGETSLPVAERLKDAGVPFVFLTGYTDATVSLPDDLSGTARMAKPFQSDVLIETVNAMIASTADSSQTVAQ